MTAGAASASYSLPPGTPPGSYTIQADYSDPLAFAGSGDSTHQLTLGQAPTTTNATNSTATFSTSGQSVTLIANVSSPAGTVNEGTETFTLLSGATPIGSPVTVSVSEGSATAGFPLPAGTPAVSYTIQATYNGTPNFQGTSDNTHHLLVQAAADLISAANAAATYKAFHCPQTALLSASVTSTAGAVAEGTVTFKILAAATVIGIPVTTAVSAGTATAGYGLPAGLTGGAYTIEADYHGAGDILDQRDSTNSLTLRPAAISNIAASTSTTYKSGSQTVALTVAVTSAGGVVDQGAETFTILNGATVLGSPVTFNVANGAASVTYTLPPNTAGGSYVIQAVYAGTPDFQGATDSMHQLVVNAALTQTATINVSTPYNTAAQTLTLHATVTSGAGLVDEGSETFTILNGATVVGAPVTTGVANGAAGVTYTLPAGARRRTYTIEADYDGTTNFQAATDSAHHLTVSAAAASTAASTAAVTFKTTAQSVPLSATVSSTAGTVNEGTETLTILSGSVVIGSAVPTSVVNGAANVSYTLPAGTPAGAYTIQAVYGGTVNFTGSSDSSHSLTVAAAATTTAAANASLTVNSISVAHVIALSRDRDQLAAGVVNEGVETFKILNGSTMIGVATTQNVSNGAASTNYTLPAGTRPGVYVIQASYGGTGDFGTASDATHHATLAAQERPRRFRRRRRDRSRRLRPESVAVHDHLERRRLQEVAIRQSRGCEHPRRW